MPKPAQNTDVLFPQSGHDHDRCVKDAMAEAVALCTSQQARLTPLRSRVLEIIWQSHKPLGAYAILDKLAQEGRSPAPPTVYRALEFLLKYGLVHRIASLNAFTGCRHPGHVGAGQFLICHACGTAAELSSTEISAAIETVASKEDFTADKHTVEITGLCPHCRAV